MWYEQTREWIDSGQLTVIGVVQEQHAERTRLYKQWRKLDWPIGQDALNLMGIQAVPLAIAIDENGVVRNHRAMRNEFVESWLETPAETSENQSADPPDHRSALQPARQIVLWRADTEIDSAIELFQEHLPENPDDAVAHFQCGVALRMKFDQSGTPDDFQAAVNHWTKALQINPGQYIYRRRIQQFGPRLDKPYPFYDWVEQAEQEIRDRGEQPVRLTVDLTESEIARPSREFASATEEKNPDPDNQLPRDDELVHVDVVVVPPIVKPGEAARVHVILNNTDAAKWNNESDPTQIWIADDEDVLVSDQYQHNEPVAAVESEEMRRFEFEIRLPEDSKASEISLPGFALYTVCRTDNGQCLFLRQDFKVPLKISR